MTFWRKYGLIYPVSERNTMNTKMNISQNWKNYFNQVADMLSDDALHYANVMEIARQGFVDGWSIEECAAQCEQEV